MLYELVEWGVVLVLLQIVEGVEIVVSEILSLMVVVEDDQLLMVQPEAIEVMVEVDEVLLVGITIDEVLATNNEKNEVITQHNGEPDDDDDVVLECRDVIVIEKHSVIVMVGLDDADIAVI